MNLIELAYRDWLIAREYISLLPARGQGMKCPKCDFDNPDTVKFCSEYGTPLEADFVHTKALEIPGEKLTIGSAFADHYQLI